MEDKDFVISGIKIDELNYLVQTLMEKLETHNPFEAIKLINSGEFKIVNLSPKWKEEDNIIYCSVISAGITGEAWLKIFERKNVKMEDFAEYLIQSDHSGKHVTSGITTNLVMLRGCLFQDGERTIKNIRIEAKRRGLIAPSVEVACLFREKFSGTDLRALNIYNAVIMHESITEEHEGDGSFLFEAFNPYPEGPGELITRDEGDRDIINGWHVESVFIFAQPA